jgi:hypothetical protein
VQNVEDGQEIPVSLMGSTATGADHVVPFHLTTEPVPSPATQKLEAGHETVVSGAVSMLTGADHMVPFQVTAWPVASTATQKLALAQDTAMAASCDTPVAAALSIVVGPLQLWPS